jgi:hypothetical protein
LFVQTSLDSTLQFGTHCAPTAFARQGISQQISKEYTMRTLMTALSVAAIAAAALATPAMARPDTSYGYGPGPETAEVIGGAAVGTAVGVGAYEGWYGSSVAAAEVGATAGTAAVAGGVAGVGTIALIDAVTQPCRGFAAVFGLNHGACVNGEYVGYAPRRGHR